MPGRKESDRRAVRPRQTKKAAGQDNTDVPFCEVRRGGANLVVRQRIEGVLSAGGLYEVVPVFGPQMPTPEERWSMVSPPSGEASHRMRTSAPNLHGDGIVFQINVCAHLPQQPEGVVEVTVEQDGVDRPIVPAMRWPLDDVALCQSAGDKLTPTQISGGFAIHFADD